MSATSHAQLFVDYFRQECLENYKNPIVLTVPGKIYPIKKMWIDDCERFVGTRMESSSIITSNHVEDTEEKLTLSSRCRSKIDNEFICLLVERILKSDDSYNQNGHILIFLPGSGEIETLFRTMQYDNRIPDNNTIKILKLYSSLRDHSKVFETMQGVRKIILSVSLSVPFFFRTFLISNADKSYNNRPTVQRRA